MNIFAKKLNFPSVPAELFHDLPKDNNLYKFNIQNSSYKRTSSFIDPIKKWCNINISSSMSWNLQFIDDDLPAHVDTAICAKLIYIYEKGGNNVITQFWSDDKTKKIYELEMEINQWYILKVDVPHGVIGIEKGQIRKAITGWIF